MCLLLWGLLLVPACLLAAEPTGPEPVVAPPRSEPLDTPRSEPLAGARSDSGASWRPYICTALSVNGSGHLLFGTGIQVIQPYYQNNPAFTVSRLLTGSIETQVDRTDFRHHVEASPQLWFGYVDNGVGGRVRWSYFREGLTQGLAIPAATGVQITELTSATPLGMVASVDNEGRSASINVTSKLQLQVWDLEAIFDPSVGNWDLRVAAGLRLAHLVQGYNAYASGDSQQAQGAISANIASGHSFHGAGPVLALEARRPLASYLALYGNARAALLFGSAKQTAATVFSGFGENSIDVAQDHRDRALPVGELELGLECGCSIGLTRLFGQIGMVGQEWWGAGSNSRSSQVNFFGVPALGGSVVDSDLGFFGLALRLGLIY